MSRTDSFNMWQFRRAKKVKPYDKFIILVLSFAGVVSIFGLLEWWFQGKHIVSFGLFVVLSTFFWYGIFRIVLVWINYLGIKNPERVPVPKKGLSVAIFTTSAPEEPVSMYEKTLEALQNVTYPHTTYLLDSTEDPAFRMVAKKYGVVFLDLANLSGAKAGKINKALELTNEEFIVILDPDHIIFPNYLDETLGFFENEKVGFVQPSQGYYNQYRSFIAKGAAEQTYTFYGPTQMGLFGYGAAVAIGANCTFRRKALESIGGHAVALAEDLVTSMRLHAEGWQSVYNPVIINRGLVPEEFGSFAKQQLKWSRGVFEVLFTEYPQLFSKFSFWQRFSYGAISLYYLTGLMTLFFILIPPFYFLTGIIPANMDFAEFLIKGTP
ncbi:MAG: glycosyltransferase, partial [Bacteroidales bacterium]|nr:glycosyltransferase [Bacteroidales bacterium]